MNAPLVRPLAVHRPGDNELSRRLQAAVQGEVRFDRATRGRYSTDASIYQIEPVGVLIPKAHDDVRAAIDICRELGVPVLPRGGGSSQCGQTVGAALVIDHSKYLRGVVVVRPRGNDRHRRARHRARRAERLAASPRCLVPGRRQHVGAGHARRHGRQQLLRVALDRLRQHGAQRRCGRCLVRRWHGRLARTRARDAGRFGSHSRADGRAARRRRARARRDREPRAEGDAARRRLQPRRLPSAERTPLHGGRQRQLRPPAGGVRGHARLDAHADPEARTAAAAPHAGGGQLSDAVQGDGADEAHRDARAVGG